MTASGGGYAISNIGASELIRGVSEEITTFVVLGGSQIERKSED
jgi:hypothetical protein